MVKGQLIGTDNDNQDAPPDDTGEAVGLGPAVAHAHLRVRRVAVRPPGRPVRHRGAQAGGAGRRCRAFARDEIQPDISDGDLAIQACANDPTVAFHAIRDLARIGRGVVALRWSQQGFGRTSVTDDKQVTPRNLMGFKDGTNNVVVEDTGALDDHVWVGGQGRPGVDARRQLPRDPAHPHAARDLGPLHARRPGAHHRARTSRRARRSARRRSTTPSNLTAKKDGELVIPVDAHIRLAAPSENKGVRLLRRGYSFTDGIDPVTNQLDAGLFFIAYQRDPRTGFIPVQQHLATDALNEYIRHDSTAHLRVPARRRRRRLRRRDPLHLTRRRLRGSRGTPRSPAAVSRMRSAHCPDERDDEGREERVPKHHPQHLDHRDPRADDRAGAGDAAVAEGGARPASTT